MSYGRTVASGSAVKRDVTSYKETVHLVVLTVIFVTSYCPLGELPECISLSSTPTANYPFVYHANT